MPERVYVPNPTVDDWQARHPLLYAELGVPVLNGDRVSWDLGYDEEWMAMAVGGGTVEGRRGCQVLVRVDCGNDAGEDHA